MMEVLVSEVLAELAAGNPAAARVLDRLGLDYCCHGDRQLDEACEELGLDPVDVAGELASIVEEGDAPWRDLDPVELSRHIVATHHRYLHEELPRLDDLAGKVLDVHGARHPELTEVRLLVGDLRADLAPHLLREEHIVFPAIAVLVGGKSGFPFGSIADPIGMMTSDHDRDGKLLRSLRQATDDYAVPADACASYRSLYERLEALEVDTHLHILKENHALFPAALALEAG